MIEVEELFSQLELGIVWYNDNSAKASIHQLLKWQDEMAIRSYYIAEVLGEAKDDYNSKYFIRKLAVSKKQLNLIKNNTKIGQAQAEAIVSAEGEFKKEQKAEAYAIKCDILLKQVNKVLQASQQRISFAKEEYFRTQHQNST